MTKHPSLLEGSFVHIAIEKTMKTIFPPHPTCLMFDGHKWHLFEFMRLTMIQVAG